MLVTYADIGITGVYDLIDKTLNLHSKDCGFKSTAGGVFFWYGPLASLSLYIASMALGAPGQK